MQKDKLLQWIENINTGTTNQEILFIDASRNHTKYNILDLKRAGNSLQSNFKLLWLDGSEIKYNYYGNIIVVMTSPNIKYNERIKKIIAKGVIYINEYDTVNRVIAMLQEKRVDVMNELSYESLEKMKFEEALQLDADALKSFITKRYWLLQKIIHGFALKEVDFLDHYIGIYKDKKILIANFAHSLYRLATLDFISFVKSAGTKIHTILGVKSKVISFKSLKLPSIPGALQKNLRVYDLNENQLELAIKMDIAKKLVALDVKELDITKIANITELPIKRIEKMYKTYFIR